MEPVLVEGNATCHWPLVIFGTNATFMQLPGKRFVRDCSVKFALAVGHKSVSFVPVIAAFITGLLVLNNWPEPSAAVAAISAGESAALSQPGQMLKRVVRDG
jgi:hypothetical protein